MDNIELTIDIDTTHFNIFKEYNPKWVAYFNILWALFYFFENIFCKHLNYNNYKEINFIQTIVHNNIN